MNATHKIIITPEKSVQSTWREFTVRYKQTVLGVVWAVIRPLLTMLRFSVVFERIAKPPSEGCAPYQIMAFSVMPPWYCFSSTMQDSSQSLAMSANRIAKMKFLISFDIFSKVFAHNKGRLATAVFPGGCAGLGINGVYRPPVLGN
jgi:ABC-type polysaccharide/polyol phosphate export permease